MAVFAKGFNDFAIWMNKLSGDTISEASTKADMAINVASAFVAFEGKELPETTIQQAVINWITGSPLGNFGKDMAVFAKGFNDFAIWMNNLSVTTLTDVDGKTAMVLQVCSSIQQFKGTMFPDPDTETKLSQWLISSSLTAFGKDISGFAGYFSDYADLMNELPNAVLTNVVKKTKLVMATVGSIQQFKGTLFPDPDTESDLVQWLTGSSLTTFSGDMVGFAEGINAYATEMSKVKFSDDLSSKTENAVIIAKSVAEFLGELEGVEIETKKGVIEKWFTGDTKTETLFDYLGEFGKSAKTAVRNFNGLSSGTFSDDARVAKEVMTDFVNFFTWLTGPDVNINDSSKFLGIFGEDSTFQKMINQMDSMGDQLVFFSEKIATINGPLVLEATTSMRTIAEALSLVSSSDAEAPSRLTRGLSQLLPWMEDFVEFGRSVDENVAVGITEKTASVSAAATALKETILSALAMTEEEISNALTITPILDLSNVNAGLSSLNGRSINVGGVAKTTRKAIDSVESRHNNQPSVVTNDISNSATVTVSGNTFEIRKEDDITSLANKIAALIGQQQRGFGSPIKIK